MDRRFMLAACVAAMTLAGCAGDPKAASKDNFKAALQTWFDAHPECVSIGPSDALTVEVSGFSKAFSRVPDALAKAGLVTREPDSDGRLLPYRPTANASEGFRP